MDEYAWVAVAIRVDMQIAASTGDTSAYVFAVVLEIHGEYWFGRTNLTDLVIHIFTLFWGRKKLWNCIVSDWHIMEIPYKLGSPFDHLVKVFITADRIQILTGITAADTKWKFLLFQ